MFNGLTSSYLRAWASFLRHDAERHRGSSSIPIVSLPADWYPSTPLVPSPTAIVAGDDVECNNDDNDNDAEDGPANGNDGAVVTKAELVVAEKDALHHSQYGKRKSSEDHEKRPIK